MRCIQYFTKSFYITNKGVNLWKCKICERTTCIKAIFGAHLRSKYESGNKSISLHDFIRPIFLVFHFGFSLDLAVYCLNNWLLKQAKIKEFVIFGQVLDIQLTN